MVLSDHSHFFDQWRQLGEQAGILAGARTGWWVTGGVFTGQQSLFDRTVGDQANPQFLAAGERPILFHRPG